MGAKIFDKKRKEQEEFMSEEHHEHPEAFHNPTPPTQQEQKKPEKPDPLQGLTEEEAFNYASSLPEFATGASGPSTEFHMALHQVQLKMKLRKKEATAMTDEQIIEVKKKIHKFRMTHGLESATQEDLNEQAKQVSSGQ